MKKKHFLFIFIFLFLTGCEKNFSLVGLINPKTPTIVPTESTKQETLTPNYSEPTLTPTQATTPEPTIQMSEITIKKEEAIKYINSHYDNIKLFSFDNEIYQELVANKISEIEESKTLDEINSIITEFKFEIKELCLEEDINNLIKEKSQEIEYLRYAIRCYGIYNDAIVFFIVDSFDVISEEELCGYTFYYSSACEYKVYYNGEIYDLFFDWNILKEKNILTEENIKNIHYYHTNWDKK